MQSAEGRSETQPRMPAEARAVEANYFSAVGITLLTGEMCRDGDPAPSMMVNRSFADTCCDGSPAIGHHLIQPGNACVKPALIPGITGDARETGLDRAPGPTIYWCFGGAQPGTFFPVRTQRDPMSMAGAIRRRVHETEPRRSVYNLTPLSDYISDGYAQNPLRTILLVFFAVTAILPACVGLCGTLSYTVTLRQRETGLRMAPGAMRGEILRRIMRQGIAVSLLGCAAGLALAALFTRLPAGMLYGVSRWDSITLETGVAITPIVSALASFLPALRASRVDPGTPAHPALI